MVERLLCKQDVSGSSPLTSMDSDGGVVIKERGTGDPSLVGSVLLKSKAKEPTMLGSAMSSVEP